MATLRAQGAAGDRAKTAEPAIDAPANTPASDDGGSAHHARLGVVVDCVWLGVLAIALRIPAYVASKHLLFDDGTYGLSAVAMRHGARPFADIFSPQGPLHLPMLRVADLIGGQTQNSPRVLSLVAGSAATLAAYGAGRYLGGRAGGIIAGLLVATTGTMLWTTGPITGDGPATALVFLAVLATLWYRERPSAFAALVVGVACGAAVSEKLLTVTVGILVGWVFLSNRRWRDLGVAAVGSIATIGGLFLWWGANDVYTESVVYHRDAKRLEPISVQASRLFTTIFTRDLALLVIVAIGGIGVLVAARRGLRVASRERADAIVLGIWLAVSLGLLVVEPNMFRNHIALLIPPLVLLAALWRPPIAAVAAVLVLTLPWWYSSVADVVHPTGYRGSERAVVERLRELPEGALALTDEPGIVWRAGLGTDPWFVDGSIKRIDIGDVTTKSLAETAARDEVCAVVVWSYRWAERLPGLPDALRDAGYERVATYPGGRALWEKPDCNAT